MLRSQIFFVVLCVRLRKRSHFAPFKIRQLPRKLLLTASDQHGPSASGDRGPNLAYWTTSQLTGLLWKVVGLGDN